MAEEEWFSNNCPNDIITHSHCHSLLDTGDTKQHNGLANHTIHGTNSYTGHSFHMPISKVSVKIVANVHAVINKLVRLGGVM